MSEIFQSKSEMRRRATVCTSHHHACDCREAKFFMDREELTRLRDEFATFKREALEVIRLIADFNQRTIMSTADSFRQAELASAFLEKHGVGE